VLHIALYQPSIPPNTGNISRQCVGMNAHLHLIKPLGFEIDDAAVKRAGLDHWDHLTLTVHESPEAFVAWLGDREPWLIENGGVLRYDEPAYRDGDVLLLGNEVTGLPREWVARWVHRTVHIPLMGAVRSYNLSNAASIVMAQACLTAGLYPEHRGLHAR
jgi:tRNA (cytidine/uridine-2'-O-)-methyltransferase